MSDPDPLLAAALELYGVVPVEFVAARNARAKTLEKAQAAELKRLRKPAPAAWLSNRLARDDRDELERLVELGPRLREAQTDRSAFMALDKQRRELLRSLSATATTAAQKSGVAIPAGVLEELAQTLNAAVADDRAADAVRSGVLVRPLTSNGLEPVDLTDAVAIALAPPTPPTRSTPDGPANRGDSANRKRREAAAAKRRDAAAAKRRDAAEAKRRAAAEAKRREEAARARKVLERQLARAEQRVEQLTAELASARADVDRLGGELASDDRASSH